MPDSARHLDARSYGVRETRTALVRFDDTAVMFTASWGQPSVLVPRPDGARRRQYLVRLFVPSEHRERAFHEARSITLYGADEPLTAQDFAGVHMRHIDGVTLAWFFADEPQHVIGGLSVPPPTTLRPIKRS